MRRLTTPQPFIFMLAAACILALSGCVSMHTDAIGNGNFKNYSRAYIESLAKDEFQIYSALAYEMNDMEMEVVAIPIRNPKETDLIVKYSYEEGWDITPYLQSFQFQFIDAKTGRVVATQSYKSRGIWHGVRDGRLEAAFNELREKNGFPPSKQFN